MTCGTRSDQVSGSCDGLVALFGYDALDVVNAVFNGQVSPKVKGGKVINDNLHDVNRAQRGSLFTTVKTGFFCFWIGQKCRGDQP